MRIVGAIFLALLVCGVLSQNPPCSFSGPEAVWDFSSLSQFSQIANENRISVGFCKWNSTSECLDGNTFICGAGKPLAYRGAVNASVYDQNQIFMQGSGYNGVKSFVNITYDPRLNKTTKITNAFPAINGWEIDISVGYNVFKAIGPNSIPCVYSNPDDNSVWDFSSVSLDYTSHTGGHYQVGICQWKSNPQCVDGSTMICYNDNRVHYPIAYRRASYIASLPNTKNQLVITGYGYNAAKSITYITYDPSVVNPVITNAYPQDGLYIVEISVGNSVVTFGSTATAASTSAVSISTASSTTSAPTSSPGFNISITITISITISVADLSTINVAELIAEFDKVLTLLSPSGISINFDLINVTKTAKTYTMLVQIQIDISSGLDTLNASEQAIASITSALADPGSPLTAAIHDAGVTITSPPTASTSLTPSKGSSASSLSLSASAFVGLLFVLFV